MRVLVAGGGIFGLTAALALRDRKCEVTVVDPGPLPHPLAESTDISKIVRMDYGADEDYTALGERALERWRQWGGLFHETGVMFVTRTPMAPGGFEHDSYELLRRRGHPLERLDAGAITRRFPAFKPGAYVDGYFNPHRGWAPAPGVIEKLAADAIARGIVIRAATLDRAALEGAEADLVVVCAGAWVPLIVPELAGALHATGQPVFHLRPTDRSLFEAVRFPVFGADIS